MNTHEQRIREFAYQIWESEGRPIGQDCRHWDMACKLAEGMNNPDSDDLGSGKVLSMIAPEEPAAAPVPEINPIPQPEHQPAQPVPVDPIAPVETPPHISPTPPAQPVHPTDPVEPSNPAKPIQPFSSKRTSAASKAALDTDGAEPASQTKAKEKKAGDKKTAEKKSTEKKQMEKQSLAIDTTPGNDTIKPKKTKSSKKQHPVDA